MILSVSSPDSQIFSDADDVNFVITDMINHGRHLVSTPSVDETEGGSPRLQDPRHTGHWDWGKVQDVSVNTVLSSQAALLANRGVISTLIRLGLRVPARQPMVCGAYCLPTIISCFSDGLISTLCCCTAVCTGAVNPC